jgi:hypothetical protein
MKKIIFWVCIVIVALFSVSLAVKGDISPSGLRFQSGDYDISLEGPFESSNSRSRYALTESLAQGRQSIFTPRQAVFSSPDVSGVEGRYYSIFTPGVSFLALPFYLLGKIVNAPQIGAFLLNIVLALINAFLIFRLARKIGTNTLLSVISGLAFLFGSSALVYSGSLTQHHAVSLVILISLLISTSPVSVISSVSLGIILGWGVLCDIPCLLLLFPALLAYFSTALKLSVTSKQISLSLNRHFTVFAAALIPLVFLFVFYNISTTGKPFTLAQFLGRAPEFSMELPATSSLSESALPYLPRSLINGLNILLVSDERGILLYFPLSVFAIAGLVYSLRRPSTKNMAQIALFVVLINIISYGMFGDPWGGWAFGPRYLIPAFAVLSVFIGIALEKIYSRLLIIFFIIISYYSVFLSFLGVLTTSQIPPLQEARYLTSQIPYTPLYNWQLLSSEKTGSLIYKLFFSQLHPVVFYIVTAFFAGSVIVGLYFIYLKRRNYET